MRGLILLVVLFSGCKHLVWRKPGSDTAQLRVDKYACERDARTTFRERGETITEVDVDFYNQCMEARGWRLVEK